MKIRVRDTLLKSGMHALHRCGLLHPRELSEINVKESRGILIVVTTALGDAVCATPLFRALKEVFPEKKVGALLHYKFAPLFKEDPNLNVIIPYYGKYKRVFSTKSAIENEGFDLALVAHANDPDVIPLLYWSGVRAFVRKPQKSTIYRYLMANPEMMSERVTSGHTITRNLQMLEILGIKPEDPRTSLPLDERAVRAVEVFLKESGLTGDERLLGFHPGASVASKMWPPERYIELGQKILKKGRDTRIVLTGNKKEKRLCQSIEKGIGRQVINTAGVFSISELAALINRLDLLVSGDTGPFHIAVALRRPTLTLFGWSDKDLDGPLFDLDIHTVITKRSEDEKIRSRMEQKQEFLSRITAGEALAQLPINL